MQRSVIHTARAIAASACVLALGAAGIAVASSNGYGAGSRHMPGAGSGLARQAVSSGGVRFLRAGQTVRLGRVGHFTFTASCQKDESGDNVATFDVIANTTAALDGNAPAPAGTAVNIHTNSDALDMKDPGEFDQVGSASDSTQIAKDGQEVDVFYTDGVNWPAGNGSPAHECFAGYTGILG
jgi:hypothetical protein